jgi:predicted TIM-barrel fold metal-dependent hydrolase
MRSGSADPIIDIHTHVSYHDYSVADAVSNMDAAGIDLAWLLTWEAPADEYGEADHGSMSPHQLGIPFSDNIHAAELYPDRFVVGWAIDPRRHHAIERLRSAVKMYRVRVYGELKLRLMYDDLDMIEMFQACGELGLPVVFHLEIELPNPGGFTTRGAGGGRRYWYGGEFDVLERMLAKCPDTTFIGHASGFWREISGDATTTREMYPHGAIEPGGRLTPLLDRFSNLYCDLSAGSGLNALARDLGHARRFVLDYQDRLLFGRDYWDNKLMELLLGLDLPEPVLTKLFSANAQRLVSIG